jgi:hypothetical protein
MGQPRVIGPRPAWRMDRGRTCGPASVCPGTIPTMQTAGGRLLRASAVAIITITLSALAHLAAGGALPSLPGLLGVVALSAAAAFPLCRGSIARRALVPLLAFAQAALHPLFAMAAAPPWQEAAVATLHPVVLDPVAAVHSAATADPAAHSAHSGSSLTMLLAHLGAALAAASVVLFVDHVLLALIAEHRLRLPTGPPDPLPIGPARTLMSAVVAWRGRVSDLVDQAPRRGPPHCAATA